MEPKASQGFRMTYVGRPFALTRSISSFAGELDTSSAWNLMRVYFDSAFTTAGSFSVVSSITRQFLHQVAQKSMRTGVPSRCAVCRPSRIDGCQPALICASTLALTLAGSTQRLERISYV